MTPRPTESALRPVPPCPDHRWRWARGGDADGLGRALAEGSWVVLESRAERTVYRVETARGPFFAKHYTPTGVAERVRDFWVRRKPQRAVALAARLARAGVSTPEALALLVRGRGLWREALLVNTWAGETRNWSALLTGEAARARGGEPFQAHLRAVARLLGALHRLGLYHGDLTGNLVFGREVGGWRLYLVDLEDLHFRLSWRRRVKNLEELGRAVLDLGQVTLRDRWGFLVEYARACGLGLPEARRLWREGRAEQLRRDAEWVRRNRGRGAG